MKKNMTTASKITLIRIALIPLFLFFLLSDRIGLSVPYHTVIAMIIFIIASATDGIDGYIARNYNQVTNFGKFVDPLADKLLIISALVAFVSMNVLSCIPVIIIIAREFIVTGLRTVAMSSGKVIAASFSGKLKTCTQIVGIVILLFIKFGLGDGAWSWMLNIEHVLNVLKIVITWIMVAVTVYSGVDYMVKNWNVIDYTK